MAFFDFVGEILIEELFEHEERAEFRLLQRTIRDASNPFELPDNHFKSLFRFNKEVATIVIELIAAHLPQNQRSTAIPTHLKIFSALHFYGSGSYQLGTGQGYNFALSQPSISRCIDEVTSIIYQHLLADWIKFPTSAQSKNIVRNSFLEKYNFPRCLGAIDCTHIAIISPPENYPALPYYCRKGYYSINCQIIVDGNYNILNMNARFPGSTHDSAIWQASNIKTLMQNQFVLGDNCYLIGDSGYPLQPFLLTPFENPADNSPESNYNYHFIRARNVVEKVNGVLKSRFRCLLRHRTLNYDPVKAGKIIYSCGVLHNIAQFYKDEYENENLFQDDVQERNEVANVVLGDENWYRRGVQVRNGVVQQYFVNFN